MRLLERFTWIHVLIVSLVVSGLVATAVHYALPGSFTASSSLLLDDRPDAVARVTAEGGAEVPSLQRMKAILMSRALRERISKKLSLPEKLNLSEAEAVRALVEMSALKDIGEDGVSVTVTIGGFVAPRVAYLGYPLGFDEARRLCADVANAYPAELNDYLREVNLERARESRRFLSAEYETLSGDLSESRDRLQSLRAQYELLDPQSRASRLGERIRTLEQEHAGATADADAASSALNEAEQQLSTMDARRIASAVETRNPLITSLQQQLVQLNTELASELASGKTSQHRNVVQIQSAIDSIKGQLADIDEMVLNDMGEQPNPLYDDAIQRVVDLRVQRASASARKSEIGALLGAARARMSEMPAVAREYVEFEQSEKNLSERLAAIERGLWLAQYEEARAERGGPFRVLDTARPPERRNGPPTLIAGLIAFVALMLLQGLMIIDRRWFAG